MISPIGSGRGGPDKTEIGFTRIDIYWKSSTFGASNLSAQETSKLFTPNSSLTLKYLRESRIQNTSFSIDNFENGNNKILSSFEDAPLKCPFFTKQKERAECHNLKSNYHAKSSSAYSYYSRNEGIIAGYPNIDNKEDQSNILDDRYGTHFSLPSLFLPTNIEINTNIAPLCDFVSSENFSIQNQQIESTLKSKHRDMAPFGDSI